MPDALSPTQTPPKHPSRASPCAINLDTCFGPNSDDVVPDLLPFWRYSLPNFVARLPRNWSIVQACKLLRSRALSKLPLSNTPPQLALVGASHVWAQAHADWAAGNGRVAVAHGPAFWRAPLAEHWRLRALRLSR